jgi:hypothetical protein
MSESDAPSPETVKAPEVRAGNLLQDFRKILEAEKPEGEASESSNQAEPPGTPPGKPKVLKDLAERLKLEDKDLYAIEVPMPDGKTLPIGKLKDAAAKQDELTVRELQFAERVGKQEAEWTRTQAEFDELMGSLDPKAVTETVRNKVRAKVEQRQQRERAEVMRVIPEWSSETLRETELAGMVETLKDYGLGESFLTGQLDHRVVRFVRDAYLRKVRVERALAQVETVKRTSTTGKSGANGKAPFAPIAQKPAAKGATGMQERFRQILEKGK